MYDVIVVGAGPAGSTAAKVLSEKGMRVLLVERHKLPRYKSCSGVLIQKSIDLVQCYYGKEVPLSATCTPVENRGMIFTDDTSGCWTMRKFIKNLFSIYLRADE